MKNKKKLGYWRWLLNKILCVPWRPDVFAIIVTPLAIASPVILSLYLRNPWLLLIVPIELFFIITYGFYLIEVGKE